MRRQHHGLMRDVYDRHQLSQGIDIHPVDVRVDAHGISGNQDRIAVGRALGGGLDSMLPLAPVLFSTTICWRNVRDRYSPITRAATSVEPPAGKGTMKR